MLFNLLHLHSLLVLFFVVRVMKTITGKLLLLQIVLENHHKIDAKVSYFWVSYPARRLAHRIGKPEISNLFAHQWRIHWDFSSHDMQRILAQYSPLFIIYQFYLFVIFYFIYAQTFLKCILSFILWVRQSNSQPNCIIFMCFFTF